MSATTPRYNIYSLIHKGLRASMCQTLVDLGRVDDSDSNAVMKQLDVTADLLNFCQAHLQHENEFIHTIMQERHADALQTADDHLEHEHEIQALLRLITQIKQLPTHSDPALLQQLYAAFSLFVAENFSHMHIEETHNAELLWQYFSDAELHAIEQRIVDSLTPEENTHALLMMLPNIRHCERIQLLSGLRQAVPSEVFMMILGLLQPLLNSTDWLKLNQDLHVETNCNTAA
jgi:hypothetical protein